MYDLPNADDLLATARQSMLDELLPHLPAAQKYTALMIASALAIASREYAGAGIANQARRQLQRQAGCSEIVGHDVNGVDQQLCRDLRAGAMDADLVALLPWLRSDAISRLQVSNPKYLQQRGAFAARPAGDRACAS